LDPVAIELSLIGKPRSRIKFKPPAPTRGERFECWAVRVAVVIIIGTLFLGLVTRALHAP
jgi:hypothetical protein